MFSARNYFTKIVILFGYFWAILKILILGNKLLRLLLGQLYIQTLGADVINKF